MPAIRNVRREKAVPATHNATRLRELASDLQALGALGNPLVRVVPNSLCQEIEEALAGLANEIDG